MEVAGSSSDPGIGHRPWTVCFYSFRGGVGRTTLAVSTAVNLGRAFLLDFDLEAPGLDAFQMLCPPGHDQKGLIEYVSEYCDAGRAPDLREFVYQDNRTETHPFLKLFIMRAGRGDVKHRKFLGQHDWEYFYRLEEGERFFENLRVGVKKEFDCDFMLVDSRSGLTEIGSVCLEHLADAVVLVFQPTAAHVRGLMDVAHLIHKREQRTGRPIPRLYVAAKVTEMHEGEIDSAERAQVDELMKMCEGAREIVEVPQEQRGAHPHEDGWEGTIDIHKPTLNYIRRRERVRNSPVPDAYVVEYCEHGDAGRLAEEYGFVAHWVRNTAELVEGMVGDGEKLAAKQRECLALLGSLDPSTRLESFLSRNRECVEVLREMPTELLDELSADQQAALLRFLRDHSE